MKQIIKLFKTFTIFITFILVLLLVGCEFKIPDEMLSDYKLRVVNTVNNETSIYNFKDKEIKVSEVTIAYFNEDYDFVTYALDNEGTKTITSTDTINLNKVTKIYSIWRNKSEKSDEDDNKPIDSSYNFEIQEVGRLDLTVADAITSKDDYVTGTLKITSESYNLDTTDISIRLRGNSTFSAPKKSYKIKFDKKQNIYNFGENKEWCLLANYYDSSLIRNYYAYNFAKAIGIDYSVDCQFVEVYLNGANQGLYLLCETVKTGTNRVDIEVDYTEDAEEIPFLLEFDQIQTSTDAKQFNGVLDQDYFVLDYAHFKFTHYPIATKYPKDYTTNYITEAQYNYIKDTVTTAYSSIFLDGYEYEEYYDVTSIIKFFTVEELFMNIDLDYSSVYFYKPLNDKIHYGPVWDFDISVGNANYYDNYGPEMRMTDVNQGSLFFNTLFEKQKFHDAYMDFLNSCSELITNMLGTFEYNYAMLKDYAATDNQLWNTLNKAFWPKPSHLVGISYRNQVNYVMNYLSTHYNWMLNNM